MPAVTLYLDEDVRPLLAEILCGRGYDVVSAVHARHRGLSDREQLQIAIEGRRAFVTHNIRDFVPLHAHSADRHYGILVSDQEPVGVLLKRLLFFLSRETSETAKGRLFWLSDYEPRRP